MDMAEYRKTLENQAVLIDAARQAFEKAGERRSASDRGIERDVYVSCLRRTYDDDINAPMWDELKERVIRRATAEEAGYIRRLAERVLARKVAEKKAKVQ